MSNVQQLLKRYNDAYTKSLKFQSMYRSAYQLTMPERDLYNENIQNVRDVKVYDSTGISAVNGFVNSLTSTLTPPFSRWVELKAGPSIRDESKRELVNEQLAVVNEQIEAIFNATNFYQAVGEMYYDLSLGQACLLVLESDDPVKPVEFQCIPQSQILIEEGKFGSIGAVFRKFKIPVQLIQQTWKDAKLNQQLTQMINDNPNAEVELIECTYQNYNKKKDGKKWTYNVIYTDGEEVIVDQGYYDNPFIVVRWSKIAGESIGRGPVLNALPDLKMLNKERELSIRNNMLQSYGCYTYTDTGVLNPNNITLEPGSFIPVERNAGASGPSIQALPLTGNPSIAEQDMLRLQYSIKTMLFDNRLPAEESGVRTALEISARIKFLQSDIGSAFGRIMSEFVYPLTRRVSGILLRKNIIQLPNIPIINAEGVEVDVKITEQNIDNLFVAVNVLSPIAKMQSLTEVNEAVAGLQRMIATDPTGGQITMAVVDFENMFKWIADKSGIPAKFTRTADERVIYKDKLKQQADQAQNQQVQSEIVSKQITNALGG